MNNLRTTLFRGTLDEVEELISKDKNSFKSLTETDKKQLAVKFLREKRFSFILILCDSDFVCMDLFELDKLNGSFIEAVVSNIPYFSTPITRFNAEKLMHEEPDVEALGFFTSFISKIENIEESLGSESLLRIVIEKRLPIQTIEILLRAGCNVNEIDSSENTLLHLDLLPHQAELLIRNGANLNQKNRGNVSPLEKAIDRNNISLTKTLLEHGADIHHKNSNGETMHHFAIAKKVSFEMYDLLCEYGQPNFEELNNDGVTLLYNYIGNVDRYSNAKNYDYLSKILEQGASLTTVCTYYNKPTTPLELALNKPAELFKIVLEHYPEDINTTDDNGNTLLHKLCALNLNHEADKARELYRKVKLVLKNGAKNEIRNSEDKRPHELAIDDNLKEKVVALLLKN